MEKHIAEDLSSGDDKYIRQYASNSDTYIRKNCYLILGRLYTTGYKNKKHMLSVLDSLSQSDDEKIRQTIVYTLGEIGKKDFNAIERRLDIFLKDTHHSVKNGLTGAIKQMGEKNPEPVIKWAKTKLKDCDAEMRMKILHGLELRGRTHPEDILPLIKDFLYEKIDKKPRKMLIHIIGQISYKKGCIEKVTMELKTWDDKDFVSDCIKEIIEVHKNYEKFSALNVKEAEKYIFENIKIST
ncbi:MAG: hypothetical protein P8Y99_03515 [Calditrichaceae bacterium]